MKTTEISKIHGKTNFSKGLNINKNVNLKLKLKSNSKLDIKLAKPIKLKSFNKFKNDIQQNIYNNTQILNRPLKNEIQEKEIDASIDEFIEKELNKPINSNKKLKKNNTTIFSRKHYTHLNDKSPNKIVKNIKAQILSNDINNMNNINLINDATNNGNYNLKITLNNKTPIRLRKINMNKKFGTPISSLSTNKKEYQMNNLYKNMKLYNNTDFVLNNQLNNEDSIIINLQEEVENLKRENLYKEMIISDMKNQLDDIKKEKTEKLSKEASSFPLNNNIQINKLNYEVLNNKIYNEDFDDNSININIKKNENNYNNKDEVILFDKLKMNFNKTKNLIIELKNENQKIKKKINDINIENNENEKRKYSYLIFEKKKEINLNILSNINSSNNYIKNINENKENYLDEDTDLISDYIENALKSKNVNFFYIKNRIDKEQKNKINLMIKMTLNSNNIPEEEIISLFMNNLFNYQNSIDIFATKYMKTNNLLDKEILNDYFKTICFDIKNKFNINNIFNEIESFYDEEIKKLIKNNLDELISQKKNNFIQIVKECKFMDSLNTGLIEINQFKNILNKFQFLKLFNENENKIYNILLFNMKKNINKEQIGLFYLLYNNLYENAPLNDHLIKGKLSEPNSIINGKEGEKRISLFHKTQDEKDEKNNDEKIIKKKIISNVDFNNYNNTKERGSDNSNNTYALLSSQKYSFDYSSKSGSKETGSLKEGIKEVTSKFIVSEEYLETLCKDFVDNIFKICMQEIRRKKNSYIEEKNC